MGEVRKTIATSLGTAFGFVIALVWSNVVLGGLALTGAPLTAPKDAMGLVYGIVGGAAKSRAKPFYRDGGMESGS